MDELMVKKLAEALRELLSVEPDMPSYAEAISVAEKLVTECEELGILPPA